MRQFQRADLPGRRYPGVTFIVVAALWIVACFDSIPPELKPMIDSRLPRTMSLADSAAELCAAHKAADGPPRPVSPAAGNSLAEELEVVEILVRCDWAGTDDAPSASEEHSFTFPPLRQAALRPHSPPPRLVYDTFIKRGDRDFERVHVPSRFSDLASSADIVATRPIPGGGTGEVTVAAVKH